MGKKYWLALANLIWLGCWPASMVHASTEQAVVASPSIQHDWYQNEVAEQARHELEQQLQEAVLAQLHPDFYRLWQQLQRPRRIGAVPSTMRPLASWPGSSRPGEGWIWSRANRCRPSSWI